jgi:hypothetical protein
MAIERRCFYSDPPFKVMILLAIGKVHHGINDYSMKLVDHSA